MRVVVLTPEQRQEYVLLRRQHEEAYKAEREANEAIAKFTRHVTQRTSEEYARISDDGGFFVITPHREGG